MVEDKEGKAMLAQLRGIASKDKPEKISEAALEGLLAASNRNYITPVVVFEEKPKGKHRESVHYVRSDIQP